MVLRAECFETKPIPDIYQVYPLLVSKHQIWHVFDVKPGYHAHAQRVIFLLDVINLLYNTFCLPVNYVHLVVLIKACCDLVVLDLDSRLDILANEVRLRLVQCNAGCSLVVFLDVTEEESLRASKHQFFRV